MLFRSLGIIAVALIALEMVGIVLVWGQIGAWTLVWLIADVVLGGWILRQAHVEMLPRMMASLAQGQTPFKAMLVSASRIIAGLLFIFPGPGSDILALILLLWGIAHPPPPPQPQAPKSPGKDDVIEGEFRRMD